MAEPEPAAAIAPEEVDLVQMFGLNANDFDANDIEQLVRNRTGEVDGLFDGAAEGLGALEGGDYSDEESAILAEILAQDAAELQDLRLNVAADAPAIGAVVAKEPADAAPHEGDEVRPISFLFLGWLCRLPLSARRSGPPVVLKLSVPFAAHAQTHAGPPFENRE